MACPVAWQKLFIRLNCKRCHVLPNTKQRARLLNRKIEYYWIVHFVCFDQILSHCFVASFGSQCSQTITKHHDDHHHWRVHIYATWRIDWSIKITRIKVCCALCHCALHKQQQTSSDGLLWPWRAPFVRNHANNMASYITSVL